jgi:hypothetical protein
MSGPTFLILLIARLDLYALINTVMYLLLFVGTNLLLVFLLFSGRLMTPWAEAQVQVYLSRKNRRVVIPYMVGISCNVVHDMP